jgi:Type II secretion system (T2SS), protein M subtype b
MKRQFDELRQWAGPAFLCVAAALAIVSTLAYLGAGRSEIDSRLEAHDSLRQIINQGSTREAHGHSISEQDKLLFHPGDSVELVDANISTLLKQLATNQMVEITRSGNVAIESNDGIRWATVAVDVTGRETAIYNFVRQIETSRPALFITKLQLRSNVQPGIPETAEMPMSSEMTISGAMLPIATD